MSLASVKSRLVLPFWFRLTWVVREKWPLNGCVCVVACNQTKIIFTSYPVILYYLTGHGDAEIASFFAQMMYFVIASFHLLHKISGYRVFLFFCHKKLLVSTHTHTLDRCQLTGDIMLRLLPAQISYATAAAAD